jgi:hypothetical protein
MRIKKVFIWMFIFSLLSVYSLQLLKHYTEDTLQAAHAASPQALIDAQQQTIVKRVIDRLSLRKQQEEDQCSTASWPMGEIHCQSASIYARLILLFSFHVS